MKEELFKLQDKKYQELQYKIIPNVEYYRRKNP